MDCLAKRISMWNERFVYKSINLFKKNICILISANVGNKIEQKMTSKHKIGFIDRLMEKLPELHIHGYSFCGPNTDLHAHLARSEHGINKLDCACMEHDFAYSESFDLKSRSKADKILFLRAFKRIFASDSQISERFAAMIVSMLISFKLFISKMEMCISNIRMCSSGEN